MITHFQWKELKNNWINREWSFSFFYRGTFLKGKYYKDGTIEWVSDKPPETEQSTIESQVHDLMLYHVYEDHSPISD
ncbi:YheE family protein [Salsuginibacillus kocurii]|uniref:YheE family protein n=1 Tax=Salsuginibacillus kocurii TaxID=427078 RepID=UPI000362FA67|nr:YheE family protein [Salsuginibacillus kocurii]